jgi:hypothetical protein
VAVFGAKEVSNPHGVGAAIYAEGTPPTSDTPSSLAPAAETLVL